jgi:hypothetical protein
VRFRPEDLAAENVARPVSLQELKDKWLVASGAANALFPKLPPSELGCLYVDESGRPVTPNLDVPDFGKLRRHFATPGGTNP